MATRQKSSPGRKAGAVTYNRSDPNHVLVDPRWLGKVMGGTVVAAFVCAYLLMCVLFRLGSWQWVLHPTRNASSGTGLASELVRFGPDASGSPQLTGEWIAGGGGPRTTTTVLYLRPGDGQLDFADAPTVRMLQSNGLNVLAFDYRGYGRSAAKPHPSEERMKQDADAAWNYLTGLRGVPAEHVLIYGAGVGASLAADLLAKQPKAAGLVLRNASADVPGTIKGQKRARLFPVSLLLADRFDLHALQNLKRPKLLLDVGAQPGSPETLARENAYGSAADPKMMVTLPADDPVQEEKSLRRFLEERVGLTTPSLLPLPPTPARYFGGGLAEAFPATMK